MLFTLPSCPGLSTLTLLPYPLSLHWHDMALSLIADHGFILVPQIYS